MNRGISTIITVVVIFILGLLSGGLFYFIGSQASQTTYSTQNTSPETAKSPLPTSSPKSDSSLEEIGKELDSAQLDSIDQDLKDIDKDASSI